MSRRPTSVNGLGKWFEVWARFFNEFMDASVDHTEDMLLRAFQDPAIRRCLMRVIVENNSFPLASFPLAPFECAKNRNEPLSVLVEGWTTALTPQEFGAVPDEPMIGDRWWYHFVRSRCQRNLDELLAVFKNQGKQPVTFRELAALVRQYGPQYILRASGLPCVDLWALGSRFTDTCGTEMAPIIGLIEEDCQACVALKAVDNLHNNDSHLNAAFLVKEEPEG